MFVACLVALAPAASDAATQGFGGLVPRGCVQDTGRTERKAIGGNAEGLQGVGEIAISADGRNVYVGAGGDGVIAFFTRDTFPPKLTQVSVVPVSCVKPAPANPGEPACTRFVRFGRFAHQGVAGKNTKKFSGRIGTKKQAPGNYRATLVATDLVGLRSSSKAVSSTVIAN